MKSILGRGVDTELLFDLEQYFTFGSQQSLSSFTAVLNFASLNSCLSPGLILILLLRPPNDPIYF